MFFMLGAKDRRVPMDDAKQYINALRCGTAWCTGASAVQCGQRSSSRQPVIQVAPLWRPLAGLHRCFWC